MGPSRSNRDSGRPRNRAEEPVLRGTWTEEELRATVSAYLAMLTMEQNGIPFVKKRYYTELANQFGRTEKAFEYRMQNISYICALLGRTWVSGLKPAKNVGPHNAPIIERLLCELDGQPYTGKAAFEHQVSRYKIKPVLPTPIGIQEPQQRYGANPGYGRDPKVKAWVLMTAAGHCESCAQPAPFHATTGDAFLEVHHLRTLAEGGSDTISNTVALCPNCHRELHYGVNQAQKREALYQALPRLVRE
ncbi:HNH endonuclease [Aeromonas hydrophila]|nr:HNH endonuclease [Aeromonas hydrophila]